MLSIEPLCRSLSEKTSENERANPFVRRKLFPAVSGIVQVHTGDLRHNMDVACCLVLVHGLFVFSAWPQSSVVLDAVCCATVQPSASGSPPDAMAQPPTGLIDSATNVPSACLHFRFHRSTSAAEVRLAREHARATKAAVAVVCEAAGLCRRYLSRVGPTVVAAILGPCAAPSIDLPGDVRCSRCESGGKEWAVATT